MTDPRVEFLHHALSDVPGYQLISEDNPLKFRIGECRYSVHISSVHDSGAGRTNDDEERIQVPRGVIETQRDRTSKGYTPLFIGVFPDGEVFTAWEPNYVFSQDPEKNGTIYARFSHNQLAKRGGVKIRSFRAKNLGRKSSIISAPTQALHGYVSALRRIHAVSRDADAHKMIYG